jgi:hypothetical protein
VPELRRAAYVQRGGDARRSRLAQRAAQAVGDVAPLRAARARGDGLQQRRRPALRINRGELSQRHARGMGGVYSHSAGSTRLAPRGSGKLILERLGLFSLQRRAEMDPCQVAANAMGTGPRRSRRKRDPRRPAVTAETSRSARSRSNSCCNSVTSSRSAVASPAASSSGALASGFVPTTGGLAAGPVRVETASPVSPRFSCGGCALG